MSTLKTEDDENPDESIRINEEVIDDYEENLSAGSGAGDESINVEEVDVKPSVSNETDSTLWMKDEKLDEESTEPPTPALDSITLEDSLKPTENSLDPTWKNEDRHIFILSSAGKPVYSRYGCEDKLVTLFGVMQALVSFVQDSDDVIQAVNFGNKKLAFLIKGPLILVAVSNLRESIQFLFSQLHYVYNQVVSVLTLTRVTRIFEQRHNYDLRRLLAGSERLIDQLLFFTENRPEFLLDGIECLALSPSIRDSISNVIVQTCSKIKNLVFAILIADNKLITLVHLKKYTLKACDLHLIFNMVSTYESLRTAECWTPICLPNFDSSGYLHGHITYLTDDCNACLILLTVDAELFHELSEAKKKITEKLIKNQSIAAINKAVDNSNITMESIGIQHVRHFMYKCNRTNNILVPSVSPPYTMAQLLPLYQIVRDSMSASLKLVYTQSKQEALVGWATDKFQLFVTLDQLSSKPAASDAIDKLLKWIMKEEERCFMANLPTFST